MGLFDKIKEKKEALKKEFPSQPVGEVIDTGGKLTKEDFTVVGVHYHPDSLKKLSSANPDWRKAGKTLAGEGRVMEKIYHYSYMNKPVRIEPDTAGIYRKGALMVLIASEHVGYISDEDAAHVKAILAQTSVKYISALIRGGEYKVVSENGDAVKNEEHVRISVRIAYA